MCVVHNVITHCICCCFCVERQQLVADIERLSSDKADLLIRLQCCEEVLKTANECEKCVVNIFYQSS